MFLRPRYGWLGLGSLPHYLVFEFLSPLIGLTGILVTIVWWLAGGLYFFAAFLWIVPDRRIEKTLSH